MIKDKFNICNIYILFWFLYSLQRVLNIGGIISQSLLAINLLVSLYCVWMVISRGRVNLYFKALTVLFAMFTVYGVALIISGEHITFASMNAVTNSTYIKNIAISLLPIYPFYVFAQRGLLTEEVMKRWLWPLLVWAIVMFIYNQNVALYKAMDRGSSRVEFTNNAGYFFIALIPIISLFREKRLLQYALLAFCMIFALAAMKRGAILIGVILALIMFYDTFLKEKGLVKVYIFILALVLVVVMAFVVDYYLETSDYFNYRLERTKSGSASGRDRLYPLFWNHFLYHNTDLQFFFGAGAFGTIKVGGNYAHNDWLEIAINQGLFGVLIYLYYWISVFITWLRMDKNQFYSLAFGLAMLLTFMQTLFSMSYANMEFYTAMVIGYCLAMSEKDAVPEPEETEIAELSS